MTNEPLEIESVSRANLPSVLKAVRGCWKATSMLWMRAVGLPVLSGVIVHDWSRKSARAVRAFCRNKGISELLLRIDKSGERWINRRGGYIVPLPRAGRVVEELSAEGIIAMLLEPASPYADRYSLGAIVIPEESKTVVEVVGPGFDASDILRGDICPHERFEASLLLDDDSPRRFAVQRYKRSYLIDPANYRKTVKQRLAKIGARLENAPYPEAVLAAPKGGRSRLIRNAEMLLKQTRQMLLLRHRAAYVPIPDKYLAWFLARVAGLFAGLGALGMNVGATSVSASFLANGRLILWDFFPVRLRNSDDFSQVFGAQVAGSSESPRLTLLQASCRARPSRGHSRGR